MNEVPPSYFLLAVVRYDDERTTPPVIERVNAPSNTATQSQHLLCVFARPIPPPIQE